MYILITLGNVGMKLDNKLMKDIKCVKMKNKNEILLNISIEYINILHAYIFFIQ